MYELLDKQAVNDKVVKIRHFSIIDEAHYMLDFDNRPLHNLIAIGEIKSKYYPCYSKYEQFQV